MSVTRAFIVRPFGVKEGINFEEVERKLIAPALQECGIEGRTTGEITRDKAISARTCSACLSFPIS